MTPTPNPAAITIDRDVALGPLTTLEVGGPARYFARCEDIDDLRNALAWSRERGVATLFLGGGSNLVIADAGFDGLVLRYEDKSTRIEQSTGRIWAAAGASWDDLVAETVALDLAGLECLSGIPGCVGATPIQNVGAYGQEVGETLTSVEALDRVSLEPVVFRPEQCAFGYRDSVFKRSLADRYVITGVTFELRPSGAPSLRYPELQRALPLASATPATVRSTVLELRRAKSMVIAAADENRRSVGSFFTNPVVDPTTLADVRERAARLTPDLVVPAFALPDGKTKLAAGWLIEHSGMRRGEHRGPVGLSTRHALSIVNRGGASAHEVLTFAKRVRSRVFEAFGVSLIPEPAFVGFSSEALAPLFDPLH